MDNNLPGFVINFLDLIYTTNYDYLLQFLKDKYAFLATDAIRLNNRIAVPTVGESKGIIKSNELMDTVADGWRARTDDKGCIFCIQ